MTAAVSVILLGLALLAVCLNWQCWMLDRRNQRAGIKTHVSAVPLVAQILISLAATSASKTGTWRIPGLLY